MILKPAVPRPYGLVENSTPTVTSKEYQDGHERIFGKKKLSSPTGLTKIIYRGGKKHEICTQKELDAFEAEHGKIRLRKIEI